jgi:hypothetical protein
MGDNNNKNAVPIFESYVYDFIEAPEEGLAGDPGGRPGSLGGPVAGQNPKFMVFTYQYIPPDPPEIDG